MLIFERHYKSLSTSFTAEDICEMPNSSLDDHVGSCQETIHKLTGIKPHICRSQCASLSLCCWHQLVFSHVILGSRVTLDTLVESDRNFIGAHLRVRSARVIGTKIQISRCNTASSLSARQRISPLCSPMRRFFTRGSRRLLTLSRARGHYF
jgi:hypothetical protein